MIDGARNVVWKVVAGIAGASGVAVGDDSVHVTATRTNDLVVVDRQNCDIMQRVRVADAPHAEACDCGRRRVYVASAGDDTVSILDPRSASPMKTVKLGGLGHPQELALDPVRDCLHVTYALSPKCRVVAAIDASSGRVLSRLAGSAEQSLFGTYGIAVGPLRGWVYVAAVDGIPVLAGETLRVTEVITGVGPVCALGLLVDSMRERVYVADGRHRRPDVLV